MANFKPLTDEEIAESGLMPDGEYDFEVSSAREYQNSKGNTVFELQLLVYDPNGEANSKRTWISPAFPSTFKHFCDATGLLDKYNAGAVSAEDMLNKTGKLNMVIGAPRTNKDGLEVRYNEVKDYVKRASDYKPHQPVDLKDEIPF